MTKHTREVWINAPKEKVWAALADFGNIYVFNPTVPNSYLTSNQTIGVGTTRHCDLNAPGASIEERIVQWKDGEFMQIEIYAGKNAPPFQTAFAALSLREERGGTIVRGDLEYTMKFGLFGILMDKLMVSPRFGKAWSGLLAGLKHYMETGEPVNGAKGLNFGSVVVLA